MEQLSQLTEDQRIEVNEHYARNFAAERDAEREEDAKQAREEEERKRTQAQEQKSRSDAHPTIDTVASLTQAFSAGTAMKKAKQGATGSTPGTYRVVQQSEPAVFDGCSERGRIRQTRMIGF